MATAESDTTGLAMQPESMRELLQSDRMNQVASGLSGVVETISFSEVGAPGGTPVCLLLGLSGHRYYAALYHEVAARHNIRLVLPDRPGKGRTTKTRAKDVVLEDFAAALVEMLGRQGVHRFGLAGHSMGCTYCLAVAQKHPEVLQGSEVQLVSPWVTMDAPAWKGKGGGPKLLQKLPDWGVGLVASHMQLTRKLAFSRQQWLRSALLSGMTSQEKEYLSRPGVVVLMQETAKADAAENGKQGFVNDLCSATERYRKLGVEFGQVDVPCRIWHGEKDSMVPLAAGEWLSQQLPQSQLNKVIGGSHELLFDGDTMDAVFSELARRGAAVQST